MIQQTLTGEAFHYKPFPASQKLIDGYKSRLQSNASEEMQLLTLITLKLARATTAEPQIYRRLQREMTGHRYRIEKLRADSIDVIDTALTVYGVELEAV